MPDIVCLSEDLDLRAEFAPVFAELAPEARLLSPDAVDRPERVRFAFVHAPAPDAFEPYPALELVCTWGAGVDSVIGHPGLKPGIAVSRMTDRGQAAMMAGFAVWHVVGWHRGMEAYAAQQARHEWREGDWTPNAGFPVAVLGYGRMGQAIGRALAGLGYPVTGWAGRARIEEGVEVTAGRAAFETLLGRARAVVNVLPLTEATRGILDRRAFAAMREDALLIQLGRGAHLVEADLLAALAAGRPARAALDVFETEPLPPDHPFWAHPGIRITPHMASTAAPAAVARGVMRAIRAHESGARPEGHVDLARGY